MARKALAAGLYKELYPSIFTLANKMVNNTQEAQDICTESFVKLFQSEEKFETLQNLKAYLFTITRNACLNSLKRQEKHSIGHKELRYLMENKDDIFKNEVEAELVEMIYATHVSRSTFAEKLFIGDRNSH
jgi:RNA polymerase sigma factor (sigma-70 family)